MGGINANINLSRAVKRFALTAAVELYRSNTGGNWADGRWVPSSSEVVSLTASVQPNIDEKQDLPDGVRSKRILNVWSTSAIRPVKRIEGTPGDVIVHDGEPYEVYDFKDWSRNGAYWWAMCVAVNQ